VHGLVVEKAKPGRPSAFVGGLRHQDHGKMNVRISENAQVVQRRNDQKVASRACAKVEKECIKLVIGSKQCPPFPQPILVKLVLERLLKVLGLTTWGVGSVAQDATSQIEKDEDLQEMI